MSAVSAVTSAMALRPSTAFQRFTSYTVHRDDEEAYFGTDGDVFLRYDATRGCLVVDGQGNAVEVRGLNMAPDRFELVERFQKAPKLNADILSATEATNEVCNRDFEVLGTNMTSALSVHYVEGGILITTAGAANDQAIVLPHLDAGESAWAQTTWGTDQQVRWEAVIQTTASVTAEKIWAGLKLTNTNVVATDNDQAYFLYDTAAGASPTLWHFVYSIGGTDTDTAVSSALVPAVAVNTTYHLLINIDSSRIATFYINGLLVGTSTALTNATDLIPYIGVMDTAGAAKSLRIFKTAISRKAGA